MLESRISYSYDFFTTVSRPRHVNNCPMFCLAESRFLVKLFAMQATETSGKSIWLLTRLSKVLEIFRSLNASGRK